MLEMTVGDAIEKVITDAPGTALCAYLMAGYPTKERFVELLAEVGEVADLVEIGIPFSDPMADGQTIQHASHIALSNGVTLDWILDMLDGVSLKAPHLVMGYYNPFLAFGEGSLAERLQDCGTQGVIVPDLPIEESEGFEAHLERRGMALIRLVTPATPTHRLSHIGSTARGFLYAVTTTGITGGDLSVPPETAAYLDRTRAATKRPVLAGFGVRRRDQVEALSDHVDGVVVGSALIGAIDQGKSPAKLLSGLRP